MKFLKLISIILVLLILSMGFNTIIFKNEDITLSPLIDDSPLEQKAIVKRLSQAITYKTVSSSHSNVTTGEKKAAEEFLAFHQFLAASFPLTRQKLGLEKINEYSLLYKWQGTDESLSPILLMSHQDVVPVDSDTLAEWTHDPFSGVIENNIIWGRGTVDIKSGVLGILEATENLLQKGFEPKRTIYLAFGHDEELGGQEGAKKIAELLERRGVELEFILDEGGIIATDGIVPGVEVPVALVGIAEKGYVSLKLSRRTIGGHSSLPPKHTALGEIAQAIVTLESNPFPSNFSYSKKLFERIGPAMSGVKKIIFANLWLTQPIVENILSNNKNTNATIRTTTAATMAKGSNKDNMLPSEATATINFRIMPGESVSSVVEYVTHQIDNPEIEVTVLGGFANEPSKISSSNNANFKLIKESIYRVTQDADMIVTPFLVTGGTDAKHYSKLSDSIYRFAFNRFTPNTLSRIHGIDEQINVKDYVDLVKFYREIILASNELK